MFRRTRPLKADEAAIQARIEWLSRRQLARRLHDGPAQTAAALAMRAGLAKREVANNPDTIQPALTELEELAKETAKGLRELQFALSPLLTDFDFAQSFDRLIAHHKKSFPATIDLQLIAGAADLKEHRTAQELLSLCAELLDNACRHADAKHVFVHLSRPDPAGLLLEIQDDGIGFDLERFQASQEADQKYGLALVAERVRLLNGEFHLESQPGMGTKARVAIPAHRP